MELTEEQKKAAEEVIRQAAKEVFPTKKEKAKKVLHAIIDAAIVFVLSIAATALGWNVCLHYLFPSLPVFTFWQLVVLHWGVCFIHYPVTYTIIKAIKENCK